MQPTPRLFRLAAALCLALTASACATPTYVTGASSSQDTIKFTYRQAKFFAPTEEGVIKCEVQPDGTLTNCRKMSIMVDGKNYMGEQ